MSEQYYWANVRIHVPNGGIANVVVECLYPWKLFTGWSQSTHSDDLDPNFFDKPLEAATFREPCSHCFVSHDELVLFIVGPGGYEPNMIIHSNILPTVIIKSPTLNRLVRIEAVQSLSPSRHMVSIPCWHSFVRHAQSPSPNVMSHAGPWDAIEIHSYKNEIPGIHMRLEHNCERRVPLKEFWHTNGGYYNHASMMSLKVQAQAAVGWMHATRILFMDNGYCQMLHAINAHLLLMGFESNNPLHDDYHHGLGAHWHIALRGNNVPYTTPHLYLHPDGKCNHLQDNLFVIGSYMLLIEADGGLVVAPLVKLRNRRSEGMFVHVLRSQQGNRVPFFTWGNGEDSGNLFGLVRNEDNTVGFVSARSGQYLHVRASKTNVRDEVYQFVNGPLSDSGSKWRITADGSIISVRSTMSLHVLGRDVGQDRRAITQFTPSDPGSKWDIFAKNLNAADTRVDPGQLLDSYRVTCRVVDEGIEGLKSVMAIWKNGVSWKDVVTQDNTDTGVLWSSVVQGGLEEREERCYDPLTGVWVA